MKIHTKKQRASVIVLALSLVVHIASIKLATPSNLEGHPPNIKVIICICFAHLHELSELSFTFASSEGRNPRVKNAFLALSYIVKSPILSRRIETENTLILFCICTRTASRCT